MIPLLLCGVPALPPMGFSRTRFTPLPPFFYSPRSRPRFLEGGGLNQAALPFDPPPPVRPRSGHPRANRTRDSRGGGVAGPHWRGPSAALRRSLLMPARRPRGSTEDPPSVISLISSLLPSPPLQPPYFFPPFSSYPHFPRLDPFSCPPRMETFSRIFLSRNVPVLLSFTTF